MAMARNWLYRDVLRGDVLAPASRGSSFLLLRPGVFLEPYARKGIESTFSPADVPMMLAFSVIFSDDSTLTDFPFYGFF